MFIGDLPAKDIPRKTLKNFSFAKLNFYEPQKMFGPGNQIFPKNNPHKVVRPYNSPTVSISTQSRGVQYLSS